jgi:FAD/FMN-containing dehydrogenase
MTDPSPDRQRRLLLQTLACGAAAAAFSGCARDVRDAPADSIDDVTQIDRVAVDRIARPATTGDIQSLLEQGVGPVSIGGAGHSMGGQIAEERSLHLDMRGMNRLVRLDAANRIARVQSGMTWRDLQDLIDSHDLAVKVMQSYSNFTVGGSVSVNCHGRYVGRGPLVNTVSALQLVTADGQARELSRTRDPELFGAVIGGYGGLGVVSEVELDLDANGRIERDARWVALADYPAWFHERVLGDPDVVLHNADLMPPRFDHPLAVSWRRTQRPLTEPARLVPRDADYRRDREMIWAVSELPGGNALRDLFQTRKLLHEPAVVFRNHEASLDVRELEPRSRRHSTYLLQEYFVPAEGFAAFCATLRRILIERRVHALNVSIRHATADPLSLLRWAPTDVFSFVVYLKQRSDETADREAGTWTRELIDAALAHGGRYYLPYRPHATLEQFRRAYPGHAAFAAIKRKVDPQRRFRNRMWDKYLQEA